MRNPLTVFFIGAKKGLLNEHERLLYFYEWQLLIAILAYAIDYVVHVLQNQQDVFAFTTWQVLFYYLPYLLFVSGVKIYSLYGPPGEAGVLLDIGKQVFTKGEAPPVTLPDAPVEPKENA